MITIKELREKLGHAEAAIEDMKSIGVDLNKAAGIESFAGYPFGSIGSGSYKIE